MFVFYTYFNIPVVSKCPARLSISDLYQFLLWRPLAFHLNTVISVITRQNPAFQMS